jgi:hypothetical protein
MSFDDLQGGRRVQIPAGPGLKKVVEIKVTKSTSATFYGRFTLAELKAFVDACAGLSDGASVTITKYNGDQRDGSSITISVNDA